MCYICTNMRARRWNLASSLHHPLVQRQPKLMFGPPDGRTLCHNCITQHNCAVKTPLFQYLVGGPKEELGAQFEVYRAVLFHCCEVPAMSVQYRSRSRDSVSLLHNYQVGRDSSVGMPTRYGLEGAGIESQWGWIFRTRPDRPWGPPSLLYNGYWLNVGVKRSECGLNHTPHIVPKLKKE